MNRLLAFAIIGGSNSSPITKFVIARDPEPGDEPGLKTLYVFCVYQHARHSEFIPSDEGKEIYSRSCRDDYECAKHYFDDCLDADTARRWAMDDIEVAGEVRHWERCSK